MHNNDPIRKSFSKAASTYDEFAGFQKETAREIFGLLCGLLLKRESALVMVGPKKGPEGFSFLDIGAGTGSLASLAGELPGAKVIASDISLPMLLKCREKHGEHYALAAADCCRLPFRDGVFDCVGSSLALQWAASLTEAFKEAARVLKPGGLFVFSTLGPATLIELRECYKASGGAEFKDRTAVEEALSASGLVPVAIEDQLIKRRYDSFPGLLKTLKMIGAAPPVKRGKGLSPGGKLK
ncbi:partial demethylmenaquinone methyltransferase / 2-methoxy-6-polyprenyl-1,4-benzoquinol methylase, partial [Anaerolineae bacterium]